jgi:hypothetical protein
LTTRKVEEKHYYANRLDMLTDVDNWMRDHTIDRVWFNDRKWMKNAQDRYEVIISWEE